MKKKIIFLVAILLLIIVFIYNIKVVEDKKFLLESSNDFQTNEVKEESNYEESIFGLEMTDEYGNYLESRVLNWKKDEKYIINIINTDRNVYGEKVFLMFNGTQYDLDKKNEKKKTLNLTKNENSEMSFEVKFSDLPDGMNYGMLICQHQYIEAPDSLSPEEEIRFVVNKKNNSIKAIENERPKSNIGIEVSETVNTFLENELKEVIDFAVFNELQLDDIKIKQNNIVEKQMKNKITHYAYIYNATPCKCEYMISLIVDDFIISTDFNSNSILLDSDEDAIYKINVPNELIPVNSEYYFILIPNPKLNCDNIELEKAWKNGVNIFASFSQKYKMIELENDK